MITNLPIEREIDETYPQILSARVTEAQLLTLGYASLSAAASAISSATAQLQTAIANVGGAIASAIDGVELAITFTFPLPVSITDTAQSLAYRVVFEPGSPTSERVICQGTLTVSTRPT